MTEDEARAIAAINDRLIEIADLLRLTAHRSCLHERAVFFPKGQYIGGDLSHVYRRNVVDHRYDMTHEARTYGYSESPPAVRDDQGEYVNAPGLCLICLQRIVHHWPAGIRWTVSQEELPRIWPIHQQPQTPSPDRRIVLDDPGSTIAPA